MQKQVTPYIGDVPEEEILSMGCPKELLHLYRKENNPYEKKETPPKPMYYAVHMEEREYHRGCCVFSRKVVVLLVKENFANYGELIHEIHQKYLRSAWHRKRYSILDIKEVSTLEEQSE